MPRSVFKTLSSGGPARGQGEPGDSLTGAFTEFASTAEPVRHAWGRQDDFLMGTAANDHLQGRFGDDFIFGDAGGDRLHGGFGADTIKGGSGDDTLFGGAGEDTAVFSGSILDYTWTDTNADWLRVSDEAGDDGNDRLHGIEELQFADYALDLDGENAPLVVSGKDGNAETPKVAEGEDEGGFFEDGVGEITVSAWDFDGGTPELASATVTGPGTLILGETVVNEAAAMGEGRDFHLSFDPGDAYQYLGAGETAEEILTLSVADGQGNETTHTETLVIHGLNDAPVMAEDSGSADVSEDGVLEAQGQVKATDVDANDTLTYAIEGGGEGIYGTLSIDENGEWSYVLDNEAEAVQTLMDGESAVDEFIITATDQHGLSDSYALTVNVHGASDGQALTGDKQALTMDFDDLEVEIGSLAPLPSDYMGFQWSNTAYVLETDEFRGGEGSPFHTGATSGDNIVLNNNSEDMILSREEAFDLESANFTSTSREGMELTVTGYLDGEEVGKQLFTLSTQDVTFAEFDDEIFDEVDEVHFSTNYSSLGRFVMDDLTVFI